MKRAKGATMPEYGLIIGLVVLAAIAAIGFLGTTINDGLTDAGDLGRADSLFALMSPDANDPYAGGANIAVATTSIPDAPPSPVSGDGTVADPGTGTESVSIGNITTSAEGTEMAADVMETIADTGTLPDGTSLADHFGSDWPKIQDHLNALAEQGHTMAGHESKTLANSGDDDDVDDGLKNLQATLPTYKKAYDELASYLDKNYKGDTSPAVSSLMKLVDDSSGVITYSASTFINEMAPKGDDFKPKKDLQKEAVGTAYQPGDTYTIPVVTTASSNDLQTAATP